MLWLTKAPLYISIFSTEFLVPCHKRVEEMMVKGLNVVVAGGVLEQEENSKTQSPKDIVDLQYPWIHTLSACIKPIIRYSQF